MSCQTCLINKVNQIHGGMVCGFPAPHPPAAQELGTEQRDLAAAAQVTESYISQLLTGKKAPPAPERTDIYDRMETFLRLPAGKLATLADLSRTNGLEEKAGGSALRPCSRKCGS